MAKSLNKNGGATVLGLMGKNQEIDSDKTEELLQTEEKTEKGTQEVPVNTEADLAAEMRAKIKSKPKKKLMTDRKVRVSTYMDPETDKKVEQLAKLSGETKYAIIEKAILYFYQHTLEN